MCAAFVLLAATALPARSAGTLKLSWDRCAAGSAVTDRVFACDTNTGVETIFGSVVFNDGSTRTNIGAISIELDISPVSNTTPDWWRIAFGECRAHMVSVDFNPIEDDRCVGWWAMTPVMSVQSVSYVNSQPADVRLEAGAAVQTGNESTMYPGDEYGLFRVLIQHAKSTGTDACAGCDEPLCIGFGLLEVQSTNLPTDYSLGTPASTVTWQGGYAADYSTTAPHFESGGFYPYTGLLDCTSPPLPTRNRTWGTI